MFGPEDPDERPAPHRAEATLPRVLSVSELTRRIAGLVGGLGRVSVEGEVSRITRAASGHVYFDLIDLDAKLACVVWRSSVASAVRFELREGAKVVAHGKLDVWAPRGSYSLIVQRLEPAGLGAQLARLEELKLELRALGWFDRKRALPSMPRTIGVVTSRDGAAFQDFLRTRSVRWPGYPVRLAHSPVQGAGAAREIAAAIARLGASGVDVIVVCRGGGSLEDLWCFNERAVAEAIWRSSVPVVSGVGHETDVTLCDLVADRRAHTPTDAAQTVIPDRTALLEALGRAHNHLLQAMDTALGRRAERLERAGRSRVLCDARWILADRGRVLERLARAVALAGHRRLDAAGARAIDLHRRIQLASPRRSIEARAAALERAALRALPGALRRLERCEQRHALSASRLEALSPLKILARGWSITTRAGEGEALREASRVRPGDEIETTLSRGRIVSRVTQVQDGAEDGAGAAG
ncbi:MAG TPA: exodeoxyribonuclease VII large subunit [Planctomycetota bacterium]|nr:exodeoxyribonuclease VII large subunit [Planctomycetota bacterium]